MRIRFPKVSLKFKNAGRKALVVNVIAILIVVNLLSSFFPLRADLTQNKEFTLSKITRDTIKALDDIVTIRVFLSENLPSRLTPIKQKIKDTLSDYGKISPDKVKITYADPKNDADLINQALNLGIPQLRFSDVQNDKFSVSTGFLGMSVQFSDKKEVIETVTDETNLEHDLTAALKKVSEKTIPRIALSSGHGETDPGKINLLLTLLGKDFEVSSLTITDKDDQNFIEESVKTLVMINPVEKLGPRTLLVLDQFLMKGGSLVLFNDPINIGDNLQPISNTTNINDFIQNFGIKVNSELLLSADNEIANFSTGYTAFITPYPFWVRIPASGFSQDFPAVANLGGAVLPWVGSLTIDRSKVSEGSLLEFVKTSKNSFAQKGNLNVEPGRELNPNKEDLKEFTVAALVRGRLKSLTSNNQGVKKTLRQNESIIEETRSGAAVAVVADSDFVSDYFIRRYAGNAALALNTIEAVSTDKSLSEIRSKGSNFKPLKEISDTEKSLIKWSNVIALPLLIILLGVARNLWRSR